MKIKIFYLENMGAERFKGIGIGVMKRGKYTFGLHEIWLEGLLKRRDSLSFGIHVA